MNQSGPAAVLTAVGAPGAPGAPEKTDGKQGGASTEGGARYSGEAWTKRGVIIRRAWLDALKAEAWRKRTDFTRELDEALRQYLERGETE